jgi:hypothetical protein
MSQPRWCKKMLAGIGAEVAGGQPPDPRDI